MKSLPQFAVMTVLLAVATGSYAQSTASTDLSVSASQAVAASGVVVAGGALVAGSVVVLGVETVGASTVIVVKSVSDGVETSIEVSGDVARQLRVSSAAALDVVVCATGQALVLSGEVIAFVPNRVGAALVHSSRVQSTSRYAPQDNLTYRPQS